ncbi:DNA adenine methylase [Methylobacterium sp. CM6247]
MNVACPPPLILSKASRPAKAVGALPGLAGSFPELRYMGSKKRLLPWIYGVLQGLDFETAMDPFNGSGSVSYLMKAMGRQVVATDFLNVSATVARALIENSEAQIDAAALRRLLSKNAKTDTFIERTFTGVFFRPDDLRFLDRVSANLPKLTDDYQRALAISALVRSCLKKQPRGVFTVSGDPARYDDGRRDLRLSIEEHFLEQVTVYNGAVFSNGQQNKALKCDVFDANVEGVDLVYLDPPYVPRADDNCYVKRYHFVEGLSCYWKDLEIMERTKVKKIPKRYTPFSYRSEAENAFDRMFAHFQRQIIVMSYSSNGFPDLERLTTLMKKYKREVQVFTRPHRYHFGTHVAVTRAAVDEYLIVGR